MPTDDRPLRDVLRDVEAMMRGEEIVFASRSYGSSRLITLSTAAPRLARELREIAPLLREAAKRVDISDSDNRGAELIVRLNTKADELEAK